MSSSESTPDATTLSERAPGFRTLNPAFVTALVTLVVASVFSRGLTVFALLPITESDRLPIVIAYGEEAQMLLGVPASFLFLGWLVSGIAGQRLWLQVVASIGAFVATVVISALLAFSVFGAGLAH